MGTLRYRHHPIVAALLVTVGFSLPVHAQVADDAELIERLKNSTPETYSVIERELVREWSRSGSSAMDMLLQRGRDAMETGDFDIAIEHFTALTDHAPDFAEGFNGRATAYFQKEMYGPALADIERVLTLNPNHFGALTGLGIILEELDFKEEALEAFKSSMAIHPHRQDVIDAVERLENKVGGFDL